MIRHPDGGGKPRRSPPDGVMRPFALLVTWTYYGTWLPGDRRGYVSNTRRPSGGFDRKVNTPGVEYTRDNPTTRRLTLATQARPTVLLTVHLAGVAADALAQAVVARGWHIRRAAVMSNHVHVLLNACPDDGEAVRRVLKGVSQAALSAAVGRPTRWWTAGGSDRYKHDDRAIAAADRYVAAQRGMLAGVFANLPFGVEDGARVFRPPAASGGAWPRRPEVAPDDAPDAPPAK